MTIRLWQVANGSFSFRPGSRSATFPNISAGGGFPLEGYYYHNTVEHSFLYDDRSAMETATNTVGWY